MSSARVGRIKLVTALSGTNAATTAPDSDANGVEVPDGFRHEYCHLITNKSNTARFDLYGQLVVGSANVWLRCDEIAQDTIVPESSLVRAIAGFGRLCPVRTDANVSNTGCNVYLGFSEAHGVT